MKKIFECPYCPGKAILNKKPIELHFRKEAFTVISHFYTCSSCNEEFTTTETDELSIIQLHNQFREKHNIPFPEEITALRKRYNLSSSKMSEILGFGANTFSNYESGEMPTVANGNLLRMAMHPDSFKTLLETSGHSALSKERFNKIIALNETIVNRGHPDAFPVLSLLQENPSSFTGYKLFDPERLKQIIIYYLQNCNRKFNDRIKLNKLLFYTDFMHYSQSGYSVSGISYRAIPYGPAPSKYDLIFSFLEQDDDFTLTQKNISNGNIVELYETNVEFHKSRFLETELETMKLILGLFGETSSWDIIEISHQETAWTELSQSRAIISYQKYAFDLKILS